jgi:23S rRNA (cytosine1962-C5)-methyltransferase
VLNDFPKSKYTSICEDVKKYLREVEPGQFDVVVLDPPAFIKERDKKKEGMVGYKSINEITMKIMPSDSILMTCSCSAHLSLDEFKNILVNASINAGRTIQILEVLTFAPDHLELPSFTEGSYLKVLVLRVL